MKYAAPNPDRPPMPGRAPDDETIVDTRLEVKIPPTAPLKATPEIWRPNKSGQGPKFGLPDPQ